MIYKYIELTEKGIYKTDVEIKNALEQELIYKIEYGLYSDKKINSKLEIISKKYEKYIFNSESAFFYGINGIYSFEDLIILVDKILSNKKYLKKLQEKKNNWIEVDNIELKNTLLNYLKSMILIEV